jgi:hypothetical protein
VPISFAFVKIEFKNRHHTLFFLKEVIIAQKKRFLKLFTLPINIEQTKAFLVDMCLFHNKLFSMCFGGFFGVVVAIWSAIQSEEPH